MQVLGDRPLMSRTRSHTHAMALLVCMSLVAIGLSCPAQTVVQSTIGTSQGENLGTVIASASGQPVTELALGSPERDAGLGASQGSVLWIANPNQPPIKTLTGTAAGSEFGRALDLRGDVDLDGLPDLLVGMPGANAGAGQSQGTIQIWSRAQLNPILTLSGTAPLGRFGSAVAFLDDINADGRSEFAVSAPNFDGPQGIAAGRVTIHDGLTGAVIATLDGPEPGAHLGTSLAALADLNADGLLDLAVGAGGYDGPMGPDAGAVEIYHSGAFTFHSRMIGDRSNLSLGTTLLGCDDLDGDGFPDLVTGNPNFNGVAGTACGYAAAWNPRALLRLWEAGGGAAQAHFGAALACLRGLGGVGVSSIAIGAPSGSGIGSVYGRDGATGAPLFHLVAEQANTRFGAALSTADSHVGAIDPELVVGEPTIDTPTNDGGRVSWFDLQASGSFRRWSLSTAPTPLMAACFDMDADGDEDIIVLHPDRVAIRWQGDASATPVLSDPFVVQPATQLFLSPGAAGIHLLVTTDPITQRPVVAVGRVDGTLDVFAPAGPPSCCNYALTSASPLPLNPNPSPTPITGLASLIGANGLSIYASGAGAPGEPGFVRRVRDPAGTPVLLPSALTGPRYSSLISGDFSGDGIPDLAVTASDTSTSGSVTVLLGGLVLTVAPGSPHALNIAPTALTATPISSLTAQPELAIIGTGAQGITSRLLLNWNALSGFSTTVDPGLPALVAVAPKTLSSEIAGGISVLGTDGSLHVVSDFSGSSFASVERPLGLSAPGSQVSVGLLFNPDGSTGRDDLIVVHNLLDRVTVLLSGANGNSELVPLSGCAPGVLPLLRLIGRPAPGNTNFAVELTGATPQSFAFLMAWFPQTDFEVPVITGVNGCGVLSVVGTFIQLPMFTDSLGGALLPSPIPPDPGLLGRQLFLQWGILDGGPIQGVLTASEALQFRVGY